MYIPGTDHDLGPNVININYLKFSVPNAMEIDLQLINISEGIQFCTESCWNSYGSTSSVWGGEVSLGW